MDGLTTSSGSAVAEPAFVPLSILPEASDQPVPSRGVDAQGCSGVMVIEVGRDLLLRIPGDVAVERAAALVQALRGAS